MSDVGESHADPEPVAPEPPQPGDCCGDGCARCVNDVYEDALARYRRKLAEWQQRRQHRQG